MRSIWEAVCLGISAFEPMTTTTPEGDYGRLIEALKAKGVSCLPIVYHISDGCYLDNDVNIHSLNTDKKFGVVRSEELKKITDSDYNGKWGFSKSFG